MMSESFWSLSNAIFLSVITSFGVILYAGFAYLVTRSKNKEIERRWRYSILWGVSSGGLVTILLLVGSVLALFGDENDLGYMAIFRSLSSPLDLFTGIVLFLAYPVLISLPIILLVTFGAYWQELNRGDLLINRLLYPVEKHFSDQSTESIFEKISSFIARFIDKQP